MNAVVFNKTGLALASIPNPAEIIGAQDYKLNTRYSYLYPTAVGAKYCCALYDTSYGSLHFEGGNYMFMDGHVKWRKAVSVRWTEFGLISTKVGYNTDTSAAGLDTAAFQ